MRSFPTQKVLVRAYWRKLTSVGRDAAPRRPVGAARRPYHFSTAAKMKAKELLGRRKRLPSYS